MTVTVMPETPHLQIDGEDYYFCNPGCRKRYAAQRAAAARRRIGLRRWLARAAPRRPSHRTMRTTVDPSGHRIALRPTISRARHTGLEPARLITPSPLRKPRRVVMLCDVSQSMRATASAYPHLMRALVLGWDARRSRSRSPPG